MKRTTYIIVGMLLAGLVALCGGIIYVSTQTTGWNDTFMNVKGEKKTVQLPACKVVQLVADRDVIATSKDGAIKEIRTVAFDNVPLTICPVESGSSAFTYAADMGKYMEVSSVGDTLRIVFNFSKDKLEKKYRDMRLLVIVSEGMTLSLPANVVERFTSNLTNQQVTFKNLDCDTLSFAVENRATVENCRFRSLYVIHGDLKLESGRADNLHLLLDEIKFWNVNTEAFHIDTEYLYGHGNPRCTLAKDECNQVVWMPQSEGASLGITLREAARIVVENDSCQNKD